MEVLRRLDSLRDKRPAIFVVSGRRHDDMNDSSGNRRREAGGRMQVVVNPASCFLLPASFSRFRASPHDMNDTSEKLLTG
jgi:hypothetical protein